MPVNSLRFRQTMGVHQQFLEKKRPDIKSQQAKIDRIANVPNQKKQANAIALLNIITLLGPISQTRHYLSSIPTTEGKSRNEGVNIDANIVLPTGKGSDMSGLLLISHVHNDQYPMSDEKSFPHAWVKAITPGERDSRPEIIDEKSHPAVILPSITNTVCTRVGIINQLKQLYLLQTGREPEEKRDAFNDIQGFISGKVCLLAGTSPVARKKRAALATIQQAENKVYQNYYNNNCIIRTKTSVGTALGYTFLVAGEYVRNPVRGIAENLNAKIFPGHPMSENLVSVTEGINIASDIAFGLLTGGTYPVAKYLMAKTLSVAGQITEGDTTCIIREFSPSALADWLLQTDGGIATNGMVKVGGVKPRDLVGVEPFSSTGILVQQQLPANIYTESHVEGEIDGVKFHIKKNTPGQYIAYSVDNVKALGSGKEVVFEKDSQKWRFAEDSLPDAGYDFDLVLGKRYISLYGDNYQVQFNKNINSFEIVTLTQGKTSALPVLKSKISHTWHLANELSQPIFSIEQTGVINAMKVEYSVEKTYLQVANGNKDYYGEGHIYEVRQSGENIFDPATLRVVELAEEIVPIRAIIITGHGMVYEIYDISLPESKGYPLAFDGWRWIFEPPTSLHVAQRLELQERSNRFALAQTQMPLSAPDSVGLQWDEANLKFLKINDHYIEIKGDKDAYYINDRDTVSLSYPVALQESPMAPQAGVSINRLSSKITIDDVPIWHLDWKNGELNELGLLQTNGFNRPFYRVDRTPASQILAHGFTASEDFTAIPNMLPGHGTLIVSETLEGARRYNTLIKNSFIYKIKSENIHGVSLKQNFLLNPDRLAGHLQLTRGDDGPLEEFVDGTGGAIFLDEAHIRLQDIHPRDISVVTQAELELCPALAPGIWRRYLKK